MKLHPQLEKDTVLIGDLKLCQVRLLPDGENPWIVLIPKKDNLIDWSDLKKEDQYLLTEEITFISNLLKENHAPDKINVASLGNMVPQLHIHVIARYKSDRAWPGAIWGTSSTKNFNEDQINEWKKRLEN